LFDFAALNWWAILVSMIVTVISGSIWFGPKTFFPLWWRGIGKTEKDIPGAGSNMKVVFGLTFVAAFVQPLFFAFVLQAFYPYGASLAEGIHIALLLWFGFIATTSLTNKLFAGYPPYVWLLETGNHLLNFLLYGIILSLWS
jgi:hypothetical protein